MIVTFYSFKGGVGRTFSLLETALQLASRGHSVVVWDLDLEAPGLQRNPALQKLDRALTIGTLDLLHDFQESGYEFPEQKLEKALIDFPLPGSLADQGGRLSFLLPGTLDGDYTEKFSTIDWSELFRRSDGVGLAFFFKTASSLTRKLGYEIVLIDSRTGYTNLSAVCTLQLPDLVILVFNFNEQNLAGTERVYNAVTQVRANTAESIPVFLLANMVPDRPKDLYERKLAELAKKNLEPHHTVPLRPELLLTDALPTLSGPPDAARDLAPIVERIEERKRELDRLADKTAGSALSRAKAKADPEELEALRRRGIYERAKTFEEKVAELFALSGGRTTVGYKRDDMQFDVRVELTLGMFPVYLLVECKDTARPVTQQQVREFASKVDYAAQADKLSYQGMLVARSQFATNAHTAAETLRIQLRTYEQLLLSFVDLRPNLDAAIRAFQGTALERLYVEQDVVLEADLRAGKKDEVRQGLATAVRRWLDQPGSTFLALLGDFGSGKTSFCKSLACELALQAREKPNDVRTPVLIDLREGGSSTVTLENLLTHHFQRLSNQPFNPQALLHLNREGYLLLIFDGFDETIGYTEPGRYLENLRQILRAAEGKAKVLLTCRTHYFRDRPEALRRLGQAPEVLTTQGATRLYEEIQDRPGSDIGYVLEFREEQIEEYLRKALPPPADWQAFRELIRHTYNLENLAERPFLLEIIVKTLPRLNRRQGEVTIADLYESYCESWFSHTDFRLTLTRERRVALVEYLAQIIWDSPENRVHYDVLSEKDTEFFKDHPLTLHDKERIDYEVRTALFLRRDAEGYYSFIHRSFLEFFIARTLRAGLAAGNPECLNLQRITREVAFFLEFWPEAKAIPSLTGKILSGEYQPEISENALILLYFHAWAMAGLEQLVGSKQERSADKQGLIRLREIFRGMRPQILNLRGANLEESALAGIDLSGAVLERACLIRANLRLATLNGADLKHASLQFANLRSALIEGVDLSDSDLRHADAREASFRLTHLERSNLSFGRFARVDMQDTQITGASTRGATFLNARLPQGFVLDPTAGPPLQDVFSVRGHFGHSHEVSKVAWSPDGRYLASASEDGTIILWDPTFGRLFQTSPENSSRIVDIAWSPDGNHIASACRDSTVKVWNIQNPSQTLVTLKGHRLSVFAVSWSPSGDRIASGSIDDSVIVWSREGKLIHTLEGHEKGVLTVRWSPDETMIASGSHDATIRLWDPSSGKLIRTLIGTKCSIFDLSWSRDSRSLAAANSNGSIVIWRTDSGTISSTIEGHKGIAYAVDWSPNNRQIASASADGAARIWDSVNGSLLGTLDGHSEGVSSVSWSPDGKQLATGSDDQTVRIWEAQSGKAVQTFQGDSNGVLSVAWAPDGQRLVSGSANNTGQIWDAESGAPIRTLDSHKDTIYTIRWSPDGRYIASGSFDHTVKIWASDDGRLLYTLEGHSTWIRGLTWEPSGKRLASSSDDHTIRIWNLPLKGAPRVLEHTEPVTAVSWSPAEPIVASASIDGIVRLWHADAGDLLHQLRNKGEWFFGVSWSPDGKYIAAGSYDQAVRIWHGSTGQLVHTFVGHQGIVRAIAWIPGGSVFASAAEDGTVKIWNFEKRKLLRTIKAVGSMVVDLAWAPNGSCLALASAQGFVELWSVKTKPRLLGRLHIVPGRGGFASIPDGYVSGPPEALEYVRFGDGWALYDLTDVPERFSPERVAAALNPSGAKKGTRRTRKGRG